MIRVLRTIAEMQSAADAERKAGRRIAVVPTMGALHRGHASLIERARTLADTVVTTIFVNPTQFGAHEDLALYPRPFERDLDLAGQSGSHIVFAPNVDEMYPGGHQTVVDNTLASLPFEGTVRPGHFRGVATVVTKLFSSTKPHVAVFGQKDAQQVSVVRALIRDLNMDIELSVVPIVREPDGLALSSRNVYLTPDERSRAVVLSKALVEAQRRVTAGERSVAALREAMHAVIDSGHPTHVDYASIVDPDTFIELPGIGPGGTLAILAVRFGTTRLLDNSLLFTLERRA